MPHRAKKIDVFLFWQNNQFTERAWGGGGEQWPLCEIPQERQTIWVSFEECGTVNTIIPSYLQVVARLFWADVSLQCLDLYHLLLYSLVFKFSIGNCDSMFLGPTGRTMS
jgi:hypothetical protein